MSRKEDVALAQRNWCYWTGHTIANVTMTAAQMGHLQVASTAKDYLLPHTAGNPIPPPAMFVVRLLAGEDPLQLLDDYLLPMEWHHKMGLSGLEFAI